MQNLSSFGGAVFQKARHIASDESGAIVVEYVLLLAAAAVIARVLITNMTEYPGGYFIKWWKEILKNIAEDMSSS